jgi:general secretion pathway protein D
MKTTILVLLLFLTGLDLRAQMPLPPQQQQTNAAAIRQRVLQLRQRAVTNTPAATAPPAAVPTVNGIGTPSAPSAPPAVPAGLPVSPAPDPSSPSAPAASAPAEVPAYTYNLQGVDVNQVLDLYADLVGRTLLRAGLPQASIVLKTQTALTKTEAIEALRAVLALNNISVIDVGDKFVKVVQSDQANAQAAEIDHTDAANLPNLGSYVTHIVQLKYIKPSDMVPIIQPFARLQASILPIDSNGILVLRDYAENVKRMLEMIDQIDVSVPAEYISEVIPIRYAQAADIANALNTLGGSGGSTVSFGSSGASSSINGLANRPTTGGLSGGGISGTGNSYQSGGLNGQNQPRTIGTQATANGTPATGTTFQQRLQSIINKASTPGGTQDQIQVFGQTKIIADERSNSLLVFATRADMDNIKRVIGQLDVLLAQVLIESVIIEVQLGKTLQLGVSAAQNPKVFSPSQGFAGGGGSVNGPGFLNFLNNATTNGFSVGTNSSAIFGNALGSGLSYFGNIGPTWDVAIAAAASDSTATVIQRPRIQTSQAKPASFFVGQTVPYVTGSTYGSAYGNSSSYSQLSVGVELDVTPFINPDGLVVMDINQEIDDISGSTPIAGVGNIPNTDKRTLSSEIAVKDRDTVMLGGFVRSDKSKSKTGVPFLQDIPLLGNLFTQRNDSKDRDETVVMIRPTVLKTPELAAAQTIKEQQRLPGIIHAEADDDADAQKQIEADRRADVKARKNRNAGGLTPPPAGSTQQQIQDDGFFYAPPTDQTASTNSVAPSN